MIKNTYLRKIVEESGRREITSSMVAKAEKEEAKHSWEVLYQESLKNYLGQIKGVQLLNQFSGMAGSPFADAACNMLGGLFYSHRCPYCGRYY